MKVGYTEFSFGYAFTENLIRWNSTAPVGAPRFPNLYQEGRCGYDICIDYPGRPEFYQFKLPILLVRNSAFEIRNRLQGIEAPFFRMYLMNRSVSDQHKLLIKFENQFPDSVYYASPEIRSVNLFDDAYNSASVHFETALFSPREIGYLPDDDSHSIAYREGLSYGWFCSEPREISVIRFQDTIEKSHGYFRESGSTTLRDMARNTLDKLIRLLPEKPPYFEEMIRHRVQRRRTMTTLAELPAMSEEVSSVVEDLLVCQEITRGVFGLEFVVSQPSIRQ